MFLFSLITNLTIFVGLGIVVGVVGARWWIVPAGRRELRPLLARIGRSGALVLLAALFLVLVRQLVEFHDPFATWSADLRALLGTGWGRTWSWSVGAAVVLIAALTLAIRHRPGAWVVSTVIALGLGVFPALTGHASGGSLVWLTLPSDVLHVWAMGAWIGGLGITLLLEGRRPGVDEGEAESLLPTLIPRFSVLAMVSVAVLVTSGLVGSWVHLESAWDLVYTSYGRLLALKVGLAGGVLLLGAYNFRRLTPRLNQPGGPDAMRRSIRLEILVAAVVLAVTAVLVRTSPG